MDYSDSISTIVPSEKLKALSNLIRILLILHAFKFLVNMRFSLAKTMNEKKRKTTWRSSQAFNQAKSSCNNVIETAWLGWDLCLCSEKREKTFRREETLFWFVYDAAISSIACAFSVLFLWVTSQHEKRKICFFLQFSIFFFSTS